MKPEKREVDQAPTDNARTMAFWYNAACTDWEKHIKEANIESLIDDSRYCPQNEWQKKHAKKQSDAIKALLLEEKNA